jgi:hypothetical protein
MRCFSDIRRALRNWIRIRVLSYKKWPEDHLKFGIWLIFFTIYFAIPYEIFFAKFISYTKKSRLSLIGIFIFDEQLNKFKEFICGKLRC